MDAATLTSGVTTVSESDSGDIKTAIAGGFAVLDVDSSSNTALEDVILIARYILFGSGVDAATLTSGVTTVNESDADTIKAAIAALL